MLFKKDRPMVKQTLGAVLVALALADVAAAEEIAVIVNPANPASSLEAKQVKAHFLKTIGTWGNGEKVRPVDQAGAGPEREAFVSKVLGMSATEVERYWIEKQYASADNPPTKAPDDASVIKLVKTFKGGIGFVTKSAAVAAGADVKVVMTVAY
jgi:ABC-type phosphate transport system substrate-binding protein